MANCFVIYIAGIMVIAIAGVQLDQPQPQFTTPPDFPGTSLAAYSTTEIPQVYDNLPSEPTQQQYSQVEYQPPMGQQTQQQSIAPNSSVITADLSDMQLCYQSTCYPIIRIGSSEDPTPIGTFQTWVSYARPGSGYAIPEALAFKNHWEGLKRSVYAIHDSAYENSPGYSLGCIVIEPAIMQTLLDQGAANKTLVIQP